MPKSSISNSVLIAWLKEATDLRIVLEHGIYRIPINSAPTIIREQKAKIIAFYQPAIFGKERFQVRYYANIRSISEASRAEVYPIDDKDPTKARRRYFKIELEKIETFHEPIISRRGHRLTFVPTTEEKFFKYKDFNYMFNSSPLEERLFLALEKARIPAERQWCFADDNGRCQYFLDFAIHCQARNIDVECDGDTYHDLPERVHYDKDRNNDLESKNWSVLRFTTQKLLNDFDSVMDKIKDTVRVCGGVSEPPAVYSKSPKQGEQGRLFD